ncbi:ATP-dependent zinc protease [Shimia biformata]|uniref:ATP-dependent zinc protease family protein n=1 Tax=Shimia biformata TaxID=1294299 RepID=UPI00194FF1E6|nr:ATP-dependent zinc protease [Shimia biformata]
MSRLSHLPPFRRTLLAAALTALAGLAAAPANTESLPEVLVLEDRLEVGEYLVLGEAELVAFPTLGTNWRGRIDTGATTTSVHAINIEEFERDGQDWVRFTLRNELLDTEVPHEAPIARIVQIRKRGTEDMQRRPVIEMTVSIGGVPRKIEVNLTDRSNFEFPVLIGRNYLDGIAVVDVSRAYLHGAAENEQ